jgi:hypothetical protein
MNKIWLVIILIFTTASVYATEMTYDLSVTEAIVTSTSDSDTPHYLASNEWGNISDDTYVQALTLVGFDQHFNKMTESISMEWGVTAGFNINDSSEFLLNELYGQIDWYAFSLYAGKKYHTTGSNPEELSGGSMAVSSNASPIPQINLGFFDYVTVPFTWNLIQIKGNMANGFFEGERYVDNVLYHEKSLYVKVDSTIGLEPYAGFVHEAQWGGDGLMDVNFTNFIKTFLASNGGSDSASTEQINALGNHLGMWDFGIYGFYKSFDFQVYYQHYFEDLSGINFSNGIEGLWGLTINPKNIAIIDQILIEYLITDDQNSSNSSQVDAYYYNGIYQSCWTNLYSIIGNSFISSSGSGSTVTVSDNRLRAFQLGVKGPVSTSLDYIIQMAYVKFYGSFGGVAEYEEGDYMFYLYGEMDWAYSKNLSFSTGLEYDFGTGDNVFGALFSATWSL